MKSFDVNRLNVNVYEDQIAMGRSAATEAGAAIEKMLKYKDSLNILFAAAPSQNEFLDALSRIPLPWNRINAFHMDEYVGLKEDAPQRFGNFLKEHFFDKVSLASVHYIYIDGLSKEEQCRRYSALLKNNPLDIVFMGVGENGHIAFNDPHVADFNDPEMVKVVDLDGVCRMQQVHDGCFESLGKVPEQAITVTIPVMFKSRKIFCVVPGETKSKAVKRMLWEDISTSCPASILRRHSDATLYCDSASAALLERKIS